VGEDHAEAEATDPNSASAAAAPTRREAISLPWLRGVKSFHRRGAMRTRPRTPPASYQPEREEASWSDFPRT
jgi:hypothetical protein